MDDRPTLSPASSMSPTSSDLTLRMAGISSLESPLLSLDTGATNISTARARIANLSASLQGAVCCSLNLRIE